MGVPGESHALDIAERSGLPEKICKAARNYIATEQADVSALIRGLNRKHVELNKIQKEAQRKEAEFTEKYDRLKAKELELRRRDNELKKNKQQEMNDFLIHSRRQLENLVRTLKEGEVTREKTLAVKQFINELEENTERLNAKIEVEDEKITRAEEAFAKELQEKNARKNASDGTGGKGKKAKRKMSNAEALKYATSFTDSSLAAAGTDNKGLGKGRGAGSSDVEKPLVFEPGASVVVGTNKNEGVLIKEERRGVWSVQFGSVKMSVKQKDMKLVRSKTNMTASVSYELSGFEQGSEYVNDKALERPVFELRLLGMRSEEAVRALEHQIDLCVLNNFTHFSVIHGKGDGILQQTVKDYLSHCPVVKSFSFAPAEDGGAGKTYVEL
jgi:DNA mismatch repair protein MutS2